MIYAHKRFSFFISSLAMLVLLTACGEEKKQNKEESVAEKSAAEVKQAEGIEIVANKNAEETKVKVKKTDKTQSKSYYYDYNIKSEYDQNARPANKDASVRVKPRTTIDANINVRSPYEKVQISLLVKKLSKTFRVKCSACHDDYANGIIGPSLLSRDSDYIYGAIADFKSGKKSNPLMTDLINMMSNEEIRVLANEIYEFNKQIKDMREKK
jgi:cytochrome c553